MNKLSYALGISMGQSMLGSGVKELVYDDFLDGLKVGIAGEEPKLPVDELNKILRDYFDNVKKEQAENEKKERKEALKEAEEYLEKNKKDESIQVTKSGLQYKVISEGNGNYPSAHARVKVHYEGRFPDGTVFDSSYQRGEPTEFGLDQVIPGWTEGLQLMREGSIYEFTLHPSLGYGEVGVPGHIPGNAVLIFKVELIRTF